MKASLKLAWITALCSGKYTQGRDYLNANGNLCCLGVLCEVAHVPKVIQQYADNNNLVCYDGQVQVLPTSCPGYDDLSNDGLKLKILGREDNPWSLTQLNDSGDFNFSQIADLIDYFVVEEPDESAS